MEEQSPCCSVRGMLFQIASLPCPAGFLTQASGSLQSRPVCWAGKKKGGGENSGFKANWYSELELEQAWKFSSAYSPSFYRWKASNPEMEMTMPRPHCLVHGRAGNRTLLSSFPGQCSLLPAPFLFLKGTLQTDIALVFTTKTQMHYLWPPFFTNVWVFLSLISL